ncbi:MAG TPA: hypothetical protein VD815_04650 [Candidatus Saccharimonadales bacterium]|nr:hypothetical protein [Candidatus Saccharimonadales bacterium]
MTVPTWVLDHGVDDCILKPASQFEVITNWIITQLSRKQTAVI